MKSLDTQLSQASWLACVLSGFHHNLGTGKRSKVSKFSSTSWRPDQFTAQLSLACSHHLIFKFAQVLVEEVVLHTTYLSNSLIFQIGPEIWGGSLETESSSGTEESWTRSPESQFFLWKIRILMSVPFCSQGFWWGTNESIHMKTLWNNCFRHQCQVS